MDLVGSEAAVVQGMAAMIADVAGCYPHGERINGHDTEEAADELRRAR